MKIESNSEIKELKNNLIVETNAPTPLLEEGDFLIDPSNEEEVEKVLTQRIDEVRSIFVDRVSKELNRSKEEVESLFFKLLKDKKLRPYQIEFLTYIITGSPKDNNQQSYHLIPVLESVMGSGKSFLQETFLTMTQTILGDTKYHVTMTAPVRHVSVLIKPAINLIEKAATSLISFDNRMVDYELKKFISKQQAGIIISDTFIKKPNEKLKRAISILKNQNKLYIVGKKNDTTLKEFLETHSKIVSIVSNNHFIHSVYDSVKELGDDFYDYKMLMVDEAHSSFHSFQETLVATTFQMTEDQFNNNLIEEMKEILDSKFRVTFFTGTASYEQREDLVTKDKLKNKLYYKSEKTIEKLLQKHKEIQIFAHHSVKEIDKLLIASNNSYFEESIDFLEEIAVEENGVKVIKNMLYKTLKGDYGYLDAKLEDIKNWFDGGKLKIQEQIDALSRKNHAIKYLLPFFKKISEMGERKLRTDLKKVILSRVQKSLKKDGHTIIKTANIDSYRGLDKNDVIEILSKSKKDLSDKTLIWNGTEACLMKNHNSNPKEFLGHSIEKVLANNPQIKIIIINEKMTTGISINSISSIFVLKSYVSLNDEVINLNQLIGRGVRPFEEGLTIGFINTGKAEKIAMNHFLNAQRIILPKEPWESIRTCFQKVIKSSNSLMKPEIIRDIEKDYQRYYKKDLNFTMMNLIRVPLDSAKRVFDPSSDEFLIQVFESLRNSASTQLSAMSEKFMHYYSTNAVPKGGVHDCDIQLQAGGVMVDLDFKYHVQTPELKNGEWVYPSSSMILKSKDRSSGKLNLKNLYLIVNVKILTNMNYEFQAYLAEFYDPDKLAVTFNSLEDASKNPEKYEDMTVVRFDLN